MRIVMYLRGFAVALALCTSGCVASAGDIATGPYNATGTAVDGTAYSADVGLDARGKAYALNWTRADGLVYRGKGLELDGVLGAVYWAERDGFRAPGIVVYRIDGGKLAGVWLPEHGNGQVLGREDLVGSPDLEGRFEIALGQRPDGGRYSGHVMIERRGDIYYFHWYAPRDSFIGNGVRIGNVMVVGYALGRAPGTIAYCVTSDELSGAFAYGAETRLGHETLRRPNGEVVTAEARSPTSCAAKVASR